MNENMEEGDDVLLFLDHKRTYLVNAEKDRIFHTHKGFLDLGKLVGKKYGVRIISSQGVEFKALKPSMRDYIFKMNRRTQIIYPKDISLIILFCDIHNGSRVLEAGTGTGALTCALAFHVKPSGVIYSYEVRKDHADIAEKNLKRAKVAEFVEIKNKDVCIGIDEHNLDAVILDLATPWSVVEHAYNALNGSGFFASFSPTIDQTIKTTIALRENGFVDVRTLECLVRGIRVELGKTRPDNLMTGHTGYLTFAKKAYNCIV